MEPTKAEVARAVRYLGGLTLIIAGGFLQYGIMHGVGEQTANKILSAEIGIIGIMLAIAVALEQRQASSVGRE